MHECEAAPFSRVTGKVCVLCALSPPSATELQTLPHKITLPQPPPPTPHTHPSDLLCLKSSLFFVVVVVVIVVIVIVVLVLFCFPSILRAKIYCN